MTTLQRYTMGSRVHSGQGVGAYPVECSELSRKIVWEPATGEWVKAEDALARIAELENNIGFLERENAEAVQKIAEFENEKASLTKSIKDLKDCFRTCRDATATCVSSYSTGMANGIEWALSCLELREPNYFKCGRKAEPAPEYVLAKFEEIDDK